MPTTRTGSRRARAASPPSVRRKANDAAELGDVHETHRRIHDERAEGGGRERGEHGVEERPRRGRRVHERDERVELAPAAERVADRGAAAAAAHREPLRRTGRRGWRRRGRAAPGWRRGRSRPARSNARPVSTLSVKATTAMPSAAGSSARRSPGRGRAGCERRQPARDGSDDRPRPGPRGRTAHDRRRPSEHPHQRRRQPAANTVATTSRNASTAAASTTVGGCTSSRWPSTEPTSRQACSPGHRQAGHLAELADRP